MRTVMVCVLGLAAGGLAGCNPDNGGLFGPSSGHDFCQQDGDCNRGDVCTRSGGCFPADEVRSVAVVWTVEGQPASEEACAASPSFGLEFFAGAGYSFGYRPVPCKAGKFTIDKIPKIVDFVQMYPLGSQRGGGEGEVVDATGEATLDLSLGD